MAYLNAIELSALGLAAYGEDVRVSTRASLYNPAAIRLGSHVRIDDFCVLSAGAGGIDIGDHVHIAVYCSLIGAGAISIADFANLSARVSIYSSSDDYSGETMTNPTIPDAFKAVDNRPVRIDRHAIIGCGSVVLPGAVLGEGVAIGAISLVKGECEPFTIYTGTPARRRAERKRTLLEVERQFLSKRR